MNQSMTFLTLPVTCRFCMNSDSEALLDLNKIDLEMNITVILNNFNFKVNKNDGLPALICHNCIENIKRFFDFKQRCMEVEKHLRKLIFKPSSLLSPNNSCISTFSKLETIEKSDHLETEVIVKRHSRNNKEKEYQDDVIQINKLSYKKQNNKTLNSHQCEICGRFFKMKSSLENHVLTHSGIKPYTCKICHKQFTRNENVNIHMRTHLGIRPFMCEICGKSSTKHQDLVRHLKIHSNERNYICSQCNRKFKRSSDLVSHLRTHTGARPYSCRECNKNYTSHGGLRKHLKIHMKTAS